jgi:hypothetical protein
MSSLRRRIAAGAAAAVAAAALAGSARASEPSVVTIARHQEKVLTQVFGSVHFDTLTSAAQARRYVPQLAQVEKQLRHGATLVADASATTRTQREGQREWVKAIRGIARGVGRLKTAYGDIASGRSQVALPLLASAKRIVARAARLGDRADELLGITAS